MSHPGEVCKLLDRPPEIKQYDTQNHMRIHDEKPRLDELRRRQLSAQSKAEDHTDPAHSYDDRVDDSTKALSLSYSVLFFWKIMEASASSFA
jgi:uncharacterized Ntn-hydrolase superfamily protein